MSVIWGNDDPKVTRDLNDDTRDERETKGPILTGGWTALTDSINREGRDLHWPPSPAWLQLGGYATGQQGCERMQGKELLVTGLSHPPSFWNQEARNPYCIRLLSKRSLGWWNDELRLSEDGVCCCISMVSQVASLLQLGDSSGSETTGYEHWDPRMSQEVAALASDQLHWLHTIGE